MACSVPSENSSLHYISWSHATTAARWAMRCWGNIVKVSLSTPYQGMRGHPGVALRVRHEATALHDPNRMASQLSRRPKAATPQGMFIDRLTLKPERPSLGRSFRSRPNSGHRRVLGYVRGCEIFRIRLGGNVSVSVFSPADYPACH